MGCSTSDPQQSLLDHLDNQIADTDRSRELTILSEQLEKQITDMATTLGYMDQYLRRLNLDYDTTDANFEAFFEDAAAARSAHQDAILTALIKMRHIATADEWERISKLQIDWIVAKTMASSPL
jgi:hypothetical protein